MKLTRKMKSFHTVLPDELLEDILLRLPVKFLGRLRCVSKSWKSLLTSQDFIDMHLCRSKSSRNIKLMIGSVEYAQYLLEGSKAFFRQSQVSIEIQYIDSHVRGSCNGVLLLHGSEIDDSKTDDLWLLNPTTKEYKILPDPVPEPIEGEGLCGVGYGFVYRESYKDYKIYRIRSNLVDEKHDIPTEILVYSLRRNKWRKLKETCKDLTIHPGVCIGIQLAAGVLVSGALHWMAVKEEENRKIYSIVAIDVEHENFRSDLSIPCCDDSKGVHIGALDGKLCSINYSGLDCEVWLMEIYGLQKSWTKIHRIQANPSPNYYPHNRVDLVIPLCYMNQHEDIIGYNIYGLPFILKKKSSKLKELKPQGLLYSEGIAVYIESVVPLEVSKSCRRRKSKRKRSSSSSSR